MTRYPPGQNILGRAPRVYHGSLVGSHLSGVGVGLGLIVVGFAVAVAGVLGAVHHWREMTW